MTRLAVAFVVAIIGSGASARGCLLLEENSSSVVGMDGAASTQLSDGQTLFAFGDTLFGAIDGEREITEMTDHTFAIVSDAQVGNCFPATEMLRDRVVRPAAWDERDRFWPGHGLHVGSSIVLFFVHARVTDPNDALGFEVRAAGVVRGRADDPRFDLREAHYLSPGLLPAALTVHEGAAYVYLCRPDVGFDCVLARAPLDSLSMPSRYIYYVANRGFSGTLEDASVVLRASAEFSVSFNRRLGQFLVVDIAPFAREISMRLGPAPEGPFSARRPLIPCRLRPDEFCYGAKEHP
ncbi:MAG: hypothetical protein V3U43_02110, partial [Pseudomonadales bacterium]